MARAQVYAKNFDALVAAGAKVADLVLTDENKATKEPVTVTTKVYSNASLEAVLAFCNGDADELSQLVLDKIVNPMAQQNDRVELRSLAEGPDAIIKSSAKLFQKAPFSEDLATAYASALSVMFSKGKIPAGYEITVDGVTYTGPTQ